MKFIYVLPALPIILPLALVIYLIIMLYNLTNPEFNILLDQGKEGEKQIIKEIIEILEKNGFIILCNCIALIVWLIIIKNCII